MNLANNAAVFSAVIPAVNSDGKPAVRTAVNHAGNSAVNPAVNSGPSESCCGVCH